MVQMSLEQQQCYRNKTPNARQQQSEEEEQISFPDITYTSKNTAVNQLLAEVDARQHQNSYSTSYESSYDDDHSSLGDPKLDSIEEDDGSEWNVPKKQLDDPVGDVITARLNEGSIPNFGYENYLRQRQQQQDNVVEENTSFDWTHILCVRNFRALRSMILDAAGETNDNPLEGYPSMKFFKEIFLILLALAFVINDVVVRTTSSLFMVTFMFVAYALIDVNELHYGLVKVLGANRVQQINYGMNTCRDYWKRLMETIHTNYLWGDYFQGRSIVWSEEDRLPKFRRKHITLVRINKERKQNAKTTRRLERDIRRSERKGLIEDAAEAVIVNEAKILLQNRKKELDATAKELNRKPPTYFPTTVALQEEDNGEEEKASRSDATNGHLEALRFCHKMVFLRAHETHEVLKRNSKTSGVSVSITHTTSDSVDHIEVVSKNSSMLPSQAAEEGDDNSTACSDFPSIGDHYNSESDEDSISCADSVSTSEQALPWLAVGAKIGEKLLNSRKVQRVVANPDQIQKSVTHLPDEAMKLIDGMDISDQAKVNASELLIKKSTSSELKKKLEKEREMKIEMESLKRPVHGMWSSPGAAPPPNAKPQMRGTPSRFAVIEMPTSFDNPSFEPPSPPARVQNGLLAQSSFERHSKQANRLLPIEKGVRIIVPMFAPDPSISISVKTSSFHQMGTVVSSRRCYIPSNQPSNNRVGAERTNCLMIKVILDKAILRGCRFAEMNMRIMDEWNYFPCHSKFPIGSCVATTFGLGVLVGWRVEDDMHIVRSLWNRSGPGSAVAYFRRDSLHSVVQAAVGFDVETTYGSGKVVGYVKGGKQNITGKYHIRMDHETRFKGRTLTRNRVVEFSRFQILSCRGAIFVPVTEHIRAAALYQLELLHYKARLREQTLNVGGKREKGTWRNFSEYVDLFAISLSKAIAEEPEFDREYNKFISHIITFLEGDEGSADSNSSSTEQCKTKEDVMSDRVVSEAEVAWNLQDIFKCIWTEDVRKVSTFAEEKEIMLQIQAFEEAHDSAMIFIRVLMRTTTVARASVSNRPKLNMALSMILEGLLLIRQLLRIHKKHTSADLVQAWFRTLHGLSTTFGPLRQRTAALWDKILEKLRRHGTIAKRRLLRFVDICLGDTLLLPALELGDWKTALLRFEAAIVKSEIADKKTCEQLRKGVKILYQSITPRKDKHTRAAAARSGQKAMTLAKLMKIIATPGRSILTLLTKDDVLDVFDRVLVRVFEKDPVCSMMINIFANHFYSIRHLRYLNNMAITGKLWETVLDAVDEELSFATAEFPEQTQDFLKPFVKLFSLGVSQFHRIQSGAVSGDWLDFLLEDESVTLIQELDGRFIDFLDSLCHDVKTIFEVMPYIKTIDHDILNLMDEFDPDTLLRELSDSIGDSNKFIQYVKERTSLLIERFLEYLPKMSIPIERRELEGGWVLTCRGKQGGDLCLSDISMDRENVLCYVLGGDENVLQPLANTLPLARLDSSCDAGGDCDNDDSILDEVRELLVSAQEHNNWVVGVNGIKHPSQFYGIPKPLDDLPMSDTLKAGIELWQKAAINDFELLQIAVRDVSYQISHTDDNCNGDTQPVHQQPPRQNVFNPKEDPTVLFLDIKNLTMNLNEFTFRVEKKEPTIFDPVFEGGGSIMVKNLSLALKVEIKKERAKKNGVEMYRPVFHLTTLDVGLEKLKIVFTETGADWLLNSVLKGFRRQTSEIVESILKEQITQQVHSLLENANVFVESNPDLLLVALGITLGDLGESIVSV